MEFVCVVNLQNALITYRRMSALHQVYSRLALNNKQAFRGHPKGCLHQIFASIRRIWLEQSWNGIENTFDCNASSLLWMSFISQVNLFCMYVHMVPGSAISSCPLEGEAWLLPAKVFSVSTSLAGVLGALESLRLAIASGDSPGGNYTTQHFWLLSLSTLKLLPFRSRKHHYEAVPLSCAFLNSSAFGAEVSSRH